MNQLSKMDSSLRIAGGTADLIRASVSDNTLKTYRHAPTKLEGWLNGRGRDDLVLAGVVQGVNLL